jgi:uncharacterized caspase-like protein
LYSSALVALLLCLTPLSAAWADKRVALVIGNSAYPMAPLRNPINDARAMAKTLNQLGFDVILRTNLTQRGMVESLRDFGARIGRDGEAVFYYSGHGMQVKGRNYLIPVDADIRGEDEVPYMSLDMAQVLDKLEAARSRANIVILDACRNNPFVRTFRSSRVGLAQMDAPVGTLIAFATAPGSEARDGDGEFGTYTKHLLRQLPTPDVPVEIVLRRVREAVTAETKDRQVPWESSSLKGDFVFNNTAGESVKRVEQRPAKETIPGADPAAIEIAFWNTIKESADPADFEAYLKRYPAGNFAPLARNRIDGARSPAAAAPNASVTGAAAPMGLSTPSSASPPPAERLALRAPDSETARNSRRGLSIGDTWTYQLIDQRHNALRAKVTHELIALDAGSMVEQLSVSDSTRDPLQQRSTAEPRLLEYDLGGYPFTEFAPFLPYPALEVGKTWSDIPGLPHLSEFDRWRVDAKVVAREKVKVQAGEFDAYRVELEARRPHSVSPFETLYVVRLRLVAWYAANSGRVVKTERQTFNRMNEVLDTDRYELIAVRSR